MIDNDSETVLPKVDLRRASVTRGFAITISNRVVSAWTHLASTGGGGSIEQRAGQLREYLLPSLCELEQRINRLVIDHRSIVGVLRRKPDQANLPLWQGAKLKDFSGLRALAYVPFASSSTTLNIVGDVQNNRVRLHGPDYDSLPRNAKIEIRYSARGLASTIDQMPDDLLFALLTLALRKFDYRDGYAPAQLHDTEVAPVVQRWRLRPDADFSE